MDRADMGGSAAAAADPKREADADAPRPAIGREAANAVLVLSSPAKAVLLLVAA